MLILTTAKSGFVGLTACQPDEPVEKPFGNLEHMSLTTEGSIGFEICQRNLLRKLKHAVF